MKSLTPPHSFLDEQPTTRTAPATSVHPHSPLAPRLEASSMATTHLAPTNTTSLQLAHRTCCSGCIPQHVLGLTSVVTMMCRYRHRAGYKFGTSSRDDLVRKDKTPGPQYHTEVSSIGKQTMSRHKSSGSFKFTTSPRFVKKTVVTPAPDAYNTVAHMEASSRKKHAPAFTIGAR